MTATISKTLHDEIKKDYDLKHPKVVADMKEMYKRHYDKAGYTLTEKQLNHLVERTFSSRY